MKNRKVAKQSYVRNTHYCYSTLTQKTHALESDLEVDYFNYLNFDGRQSHFETQPFSIRYKIYGKEQRYTPDFLVIIDGTTYVVEIKPTKYTKGDHFQHKVRVLEAFFAKHDQRFVVRTERDIRIGERAKNLEYLQSAIQQQAPVEEVSRFLRTLPYKSTRVGNFQQSLRDKGLDPGLCRKAVAHKLVKADLTQKWADVELSW